MTASNLYRSRDQLWSDLVVALGGEEAFLTRNFSERQFLFEILDLLGGSSTNLNLGGLENIWIAIVNAAGGSVSQHMSERDLIAEFVVALGGDPISPNYHSKSELLAAAVNAAATGGGGGGETFVLQLGGLNLQLGGLNLTLTVA